MANPLKRAAKRVRNATGRIQKLMGQQPAYSYQSERAAPYFEPKQGRGAARWSVGDEYEKPNAKDLYFMYNVAGRYRKGIAIVVTGITEGDYPGKEGEPYVTLSARVNTRVMNNALENPNNKDAKDIINQVFSRAHKNIEWTTVYKVSIVYEGV